MSKLRSLTADEIKVMDSVLVNSTTKVADGRLVEPFSADELAKNRNGCVVNPYSSRMCELGTKCCVVRHSAVPE